MTPLAWTFEDGPDITIASSDDVGVVPDFSRDLRHRFHHTNIAKVSREASAQNATKYAGEIHESFGIQVMFRKGSLSPSAQVAASPHQHPSRGNRAVRFTSDSSRRSRTSVDVRSRPM